MRIWTNGLRFLSWDTSRASRQSCGPLGRYGHAVTTNGPSVPGLMALSEALPRVCFCEDWVISVSKNPGEHWTSPSSSFSHRETEACQGNGRPRSRTEAEAGLPGPLCSLQLCRLSSWPHRIVPWGCPGRAGPHHFEGFSISTERLWRVDSLRPLSGAVALPRWRWRETPDVPPRSPPA